MSIMKLNQIGCVDAAVKIIQNSGTVILPSDTVYGVFADATDPVAVDKIYSLKERRKDNPIGIMVDPSDVDKYAYVNKYAKIIIEMVFPAPVGIILKKRDCIPDFLTSGRDTVMVMCHEQPIIGKIYRKVKRPLAATSVNISGQPAATTFEEVLPFENKTGMIINGGKTKHLVNGTVLDLTENPIVQRVGSFSVEKIIELLGPVEVLDENIKDNSIIELQTQGECL